MTSKDLPRQSRLGFLAAVLTLAAFLVGCSNSTEPKSEAPDLPPLQSMQMDLSLFEDQPKPGESELHQTKLNFLNAAVRAAYVNVTVITALKPPSLAFAAAIHTVPSRVDDSYLWIYTWVDGGQDHQVRLRGTPSDGHVDWELSVVLPGEEPVLWFSGRSSDEEDAGYWIFRDFTKEGDPEVLRIDWEVNSENDATLDFRNIFVGSDEEGDELHYRADGSLRSIVFEDASTGEDWDVIWNEADGSGSLRVPDYRNGERACWDSSQENIECPAAAESFLAGRNR